MSDGATIDTSRAPLRAADRSSRRQHRCCCGCCSRASTSARLWASARQRVAALALVALASTRSTCWRAPGAGGCCSTPRTFTCAAAALLGSFLVARSSTISCRATSAATSSASAIPPRRRGRRHWPRRSCSWIACWVSWGWCWWRRSAPRSPAAAHRPRMPIWPVVAVGGLSGRRGRVGAGLLAPRLRPAAAAADGLASRVGRRAHRTLTSVARAVPRSAGRARQLLRRRGVRPGLDGRVLLRRRLRPAHHVDVLGSRGDRAALVRRADAAGLGERLRCARSDLLFLFQHASACRSSRPC